MDFDGDGVITKDDIQQAAKRDNQDMEDEEIQNMMRQADKNGDGKITFVRNRLPLRL
jgi:Ca2+-binding EF-hand superfamily protein